MKNVIIAMLTKISAVDAELKKLTAQVEVQSLLLNAIVLTVGADGGLTAMLENLNKAINSVVESDEGIIKSDAELLLTEFQNQLLIAKHIESAHKQLDMQALRELEESKV